MTTHPETVFAVPPPPCSLLEDDYPWMVSLEVEVMVFFYTIQAAEMGGKKPGPMMELLAGAIIPLGGGGTKFPPQQSDAAPDACSHLPPLCRLTALE